MAVAAVKLNARLNDVRIEVRKADVRDLTVEPGSLVLVGDVFYDDSIAAAMLPALTAFVAAGAEVIVGDPHRAYLPTEQLQRLATYDVEVETDIEDTPVKPTLVGRLLAEPRPS
jgi:predicted nicotinamide N-methyase